MTAEIIDINRFCNEEDPPKTINEALLRVSRLNKKFPQKDGLITVGVKDLRKFFETEINNILLENRLIELEFFMCSLFIASLLTKISYSNPESWYGVDYVLRYEQTSNPIFLVDGANICFLMSSLFQKRSEHRTMKKEDYMNIGSGLYAQFYECTHQEIGFHMSQSFETMADVTQECFQQFQK